MDGDVLAVTDGREITPQHASWLIDALTDIVARAAAATLAVSYASVERHTKDDQSPVTAADEASETLIIEGVNRLLPGVPVVAEESVARMAAVSLEPSFISVDPLDGTKEFLAGRDEFTVNLAIVTYGTPIMGLIAAPARGLLWRGIPGACAERLQMRFDAGRAEAHDPVSIHTRKAHARLTVVTSRTHLDRDSEAFLAHLPVGARQPCGSSVKFCLIGQGDADIYPRLAPTREWDIAAGCAILAAAGGTVTVPGGGVPRFGRAAEKFRVPGFIAWGDPALAATARR